MLKFTLNTGNSMRVRKKTCLKLKNPFKHLMQRLEEVHNRSSILISLETLWKDSTTYNNLLIPNQVKLSVAISWVNKKVIIITTKATEEESFHQLVQQPCFLRKLECLKVLRDPLDLKAVCQSSVIHRQRSLKKDQQTLKIMAHWMELLVY